MKAAHRRAVHEVGLSPDPHGAVKGAAGAAVAATGRLGWKMVSPYVFQEPTGNLLDVRQEAPHTVRLAALEAVQRWFASSSSLGEQVGGIPYLEPLLEVSNKKATPLAPRPVLGPWRREAGPPKTAFLKPV